MKGKNKIKILLWTLLISLTIVLSSCCGCTDDQDTIDVYPNTVKVYKLYNAPEGEPESGFSNKIRIRTYTIDGQTWEVFYANGEIRQVLINGQAPNIQVPVKQEENSVLSQETYFDY